MDYTIGFDAPPEKIYQDFTSREYWQTLMDSYRFLTPQSEITRFRSDERGTDIVIKQNLPRMYLPAVARAVMPGDMIITREQHFDPYDHTTNAAKGTYGASDAARTRSLRRRVLPHRDRHRQSAAVGQRVQGVGPVHRRRARGPDPAPHQTALRRRGGVHR